MNKQQKIEYLRNMIILIKIHIKLSKLQLSELLNYLEDYEQEYNKLKSGKND